jgi:hypothetical protein
MKKNFLAVLIFSGLTTLVSAQCLTINCPASPSVNNDPGVCGAVVNYSAPVVNSTCAGAITDTFYYSGVMQTYVVPAGVTSVTIQAWGAQGGANWVNNVNFGGYSKADFSVTPGETLYIFVGQQPTTITGGYNGGGNGEGAGKGGGGASDVRQGGTTLNDRIIVGGGGGGAGYWSSLHVVGGVGGGMTGGDGYRAPDYSSNPGGLGGGQSAPGANGTCVSLYNTACAGSFGQGGAPSGCGCEGYGGGGGWYGGAGSGNCRGGGGGSGYILPIAANPTMTAGIRTGNGLVVVSYNGPAPATMTQTAGLASGSTFPIGVTTNTFTASDAFGNTASCSFTVTVADNEAPVISGMPTVFTANDSGQCGAVVVWAAPIITDNCPGFTVTQDHNSGDFFPTGITTVTYTATDGTNTTTGTFSVTVTDAEAPSISPLSNVSVSNDAGQCGATVTWTAPTITDNCSGVTFTQTHNSGDFFPIGNTTVSYTATDGINSTTSSFTVTVTDTEMPVLSGCSPDVSACPGIVIFGNAPTATDNCSATVSQISGPASGDSLAAGTYPVMYVAMDPSGNTDTCGFTITVHPNPSVTLSLAATSVCIDDAPFTLSGASPAGGVFSGNGVSGTTFSPVLAATGMQVITYLYTDTNGCEASAMDTITVNACTGITENGNATFSLYPNPASGSFWFTSKENGTMELLDVNGQLLKTEMIISGKQEIQLNGFAEGIYTVRFTAVNGKVSAGKLLIRK